MEIRGVLPAMINLIDLAKLQERCDPYLYRVWDGLEHPLTVLEVLQAVEDGDIDEPEHHGCDELWTREKHIQRVAWFVGHSRHRQRYSAMTRGLMLSALLLVFGGFVVFLASAFLWESFSASIAAMTTLLGLFLFRLGIAQMERDRKIAH